MSDNNNSINDDDDEEEEEADREKADSINLTTAANGLLSVRRPREREEERATRRTTKVACDDSIEPVEQVISCDNDDDDDDQDDEEDSSEGQSTCTILAQSDTLPKKAAVVETASSSSSSSRRLAAGDANVQLGGEQILSVASLFVTAAAASRSVSSNESCAIKSGGSSSVASSLSLVRAEDSEEGDLMEIDLRPQRQQVENDDDEEVTSIPQQQQQSRAEMSPPTNHQRRNHYQQQQQQQQDFGSFVQQQQQQQQQCGFRDAQPKISFASRRMKEYFESFKSHSSETVRLYQFFKSTRTELVACLLFVLISSQTLIASRSRLQSSANNKQGQDGGAVWPLARASLAAATDDAEQQPPVATTNQTSSAWQQSWTRSAHDATSMGPHLVNGLAMSFTVATLTQVFGHISGCHLVPSVSVALCVKGHISRARLASYLAAQLVGSLLGVSLLSLLTSSQLTAHEYHALLQSPPMAIRSHLASAAASSHSGSVAINHFHHQVQSAFTRRRRRWAASSSDALQSSSPATTGDDTRAFGSEASFLTLPPPPDPELINLNDTQGSETILLSIMEQQHQERLDKRSGRRTEGLQEATDAPGTFQVASSASLGGGSQPKPPPSTLAPTLTFGGNGVSAGAVKAASSASTGQAASIVVVVDEAGEFGRRADNEQRPNSASDDKSRVFRHANGIITTSGAVATAVPRDEPLATLLGRRSPEVTTTLAAAAKQQAPTAAEGAGQQQGPVVAAVADASDAGANKGVRRLRRRKRNRHNSVATAAGVDQSVAANSNNINNNSRGRGADEQPPAAAAATATTSLNSGAATDSKYYVNLLEFALPDSIMSSESIRQCIEGQRRRVVALSQPLSDVTRQQQQQPPTPQPQPTWSAAASKLLAERAFDHCLSLSNSSQMFIFQLVATLLIVLTYLVNVDPRRVDLGFKSLSIGLAYFVASALTLQSGGFYGNPFHLLFLSWLSPTSEWRTEWFVYLVTPFIGGLFGAISHEYIDFTSARNRGKQLHLRRSFYSLDQLRAPTAAEADQREQQQQQQTTTTRANIEPTIATLMPASARRKISLSSSSSSSLDSAGAASSVLTINHQPQQQQQPDRRRRHQQQHYLRQPQQLAANAAGRKLGHQPAACCSRNGPEGGRGGEAASNQPASFVNAGASPIRAAAGQRRQCKQLSSGPSSPARRGLLTLSAADSRAAFSASTDLDRSNFLISSSLSPTATPQRQFSTTLGLM